MTTQLDSWLALTEEEAIDPGMPICDPHHHFWDRPDGRYFLDELLKDTGSGHQVAQTVFIECRSMYRQAGPPELQPVGEVEFVQGIAAQSASGQYGPTAVAAGIVGFADLMLGDAIIPVLEAHAVAGKDRFRGIRCTAAWDPSPEVTTARANGPGMMADPKFREGIGVLQRMGLSYDAILYHPQLPELASLARAFPDLTIILNHVGRPLGIGPYAGKRDEVLQEWKQGIDAAAECPNVVVKVGGLGNPISGFDWHQRPFPPASGEVAEAGAPYYLYCIEKFGADRCMFESNFPVDKQSYSYTVCWNAFKRLARDFSADEQAALFHNTAAKAYRLPLLTDL
jgi:predicted TIM-barrel fold metal-dependent hydrolase